MSSDYKYSFVVEGDDSEPEIREIVIPAAEMERRTRELFASDLPPTIIGLPVVRDDSVKSPLRPKQPRSKYRRQW